MTQDRLYKRYSLSPKPPEADELNALIQKSVESGIYQFYKRMDSFLHRLELERSLYGQQQDDQSDFITMDHIWIYVYGYLIANGLCITVFIGEMLYFHWERILSCLRRGVFEAQRMMRKIKNELLHNRIRRFFERCVVGTLRMLYLGRGFAALRRVMQRMKDTLLRNKIWIYFERGISATQRLIHRIGSRRTRVQPFH